MTVSERIRVLFPRRQVLTAKNMTLTETHPLQDPPTVAMPLLRLVVDYCRLHGLQHGTLFTGLPVDADARLSFDSFARICASAAAALGDPAFGLHLGLQARPGHLGVHGFTLMSCANGHQQLERSLRYSSLVNAGFRNEVVLEESSCIRFWRPNGAASGSYDRIQKDLSVALWIAISRQVSGFEHAAPSWVSFSYPRPGNALEYEQAFACPVHFAAPDTAACFPRKLLDQAMPQANEEVRQAMDHLCEQWLKRQVESSRPAWLGECRRFIIQAFGEAPPSLSGVAAQLGLLPGELKRLLAGQQLNFRKLVDTLRFELARSYIGDARLSLVDVAYLLGFSEQSAFQRAFKRWSGLTPGEFREQARRQ